MELRARRETAGGERGATGAGAGSRGWEGEESEGGGTATGGRGHGAPGTSTDDNANGRYVTLRVTFSGASRKVKVAMPPRSCKNRSNRYPTPIQLPTPFENITFFPFIKFLNDEMSHCCRVLFNSQFQSFELLQWLYTAKLKQKKGSGFQSSVVMTVSYFFVISKSLLEIIGKCAIGSSE